MPKQEDNILDLLNCQGAKEIAQDTHVNHSYVCHISYGKMIGWT